MAFLEIDRLVKSFGATAVLKDISVAVEEGAFLVLLGPSGCGKSTLLNSIAGLEPVTSGDILINGQRVNDLHPSRRDIAMVFQSYALYPNMTVAQNMAFGMEMRGVPKAERDQRVAEVAAILQIEHLLRRRPSQLSGGQRQRVAMGRALVRRPQVFLFDEPLSNLDAKLRIDMRTEIKRLHHRLNTTIVYVTHDQIEAMTLATQIAVMKDGQIEQIGSPFEVYRRPATMFVADFMGAPAMNLIPATVVQDGDQTSLQIERKDEPPLCLPLNGAQGGLRAHSGKGVIFGLRPEAITDDPGDVARHHGVVVAECLVDVVEPAGADTFVICHLGGKEVFARLSPDLAPRAGERMRFAFDLEKAAFYDPASEKLIG